MALQITSNGKDITNFVKGKSVKITQNLNEYVDVMNFQIIEKTGRQFIPPYNARIELSIDGAVFFSGHLSRRYRTRVSRQFVLWEVTVADATELLERGLATVVYTNTNAATVLQNLITASEQPITISPDNFSVSNPSVSRISFNGLTIGQSISKLSKFIGRVWWVDANRVLHMREQSSLPTVQVTDDGTGLSWISNSIRAKDDLSQIRNRVEVHGASVVGEEVSKTVRGNGSDTIFSTIVPFSGVPDVTVDGTKQEVGVEYASTDIDDIDVFYDSGSDTIRFKTAPANNAAIVITGARLVPIFYNTEDAGSIRQFGRRTYRTTDRTIRTLSDAVQRANRELETYKLPHISGSLRTYDILGVSVGSRLAMNIPSLNLRTFAIVNGMQISWRDPSGDLPVATISFYSTKQFGVIDWVAGFPSEDEREISIARTSAAAQSFTADGDTFGVADKNQAIKQGIPPVPTFPRNPWTGQVIQLTEIAALRQPPVNVDYPVSGASGATSTSAGGNRSKVITLINRGDGGDARIYRLSGNQWVFDGRLDGQSGARVSPRGLTTRGNGYYWYTISRSDKWTIYSDAGSRLNTIAQSPNSAGTSTGTDPIANIQSHSSGLYAIIVRNPSIVNRRVQVSSRTTHHELWRYSGGSWTRIDLPPLERTEQLTGLFENRNGQIGIETTTNFISTVEGNTSISKIYALSGGSWVLDEVFPPNRGVFTLGRGIVEFADRSFFTGRQLVAYRNYQPTTWVDA